MRRNRNVKIVRSEEPGNQPVLEIALKPQPREEEGGDRDGDGGVRRAEAHCGNQD